MGTCGAPRVAAPRGALGSGPRSPHERRANLDKPRREPPSRTNPAHAQKCLLNDVAPCVFGDCSTKRGARTRLVNETGLFSKHFCAWAGLGWRRRGWGPEDCGRACLPIFSRGAVHAARGRRVQNTEPGSEALGNASFEHAFANTAKDASWPPGEGDQPCPPPEQAEGGGNNRGGKRWGKKHLETGVSGGGGY